MNRVAAGAAVLTAASTSTVEQVLNSFRVRVVVDQQNSLRLEQAALVVGILCRTFANVRVVGVGPENRQFVSSLHPECMFDDYPEDCNADVTVALCSAAIDGPRVYASYLDWSAVLATDSAPVCGGENILAALYSAALACQHAFNLAFASHIPAIDLLSGTQSWDLIQGQKGSTPAGAPSLQSSQPCVDLLLVGLA